MTMSTKEEVEAAAQQFNGYVCGDIPYTWLSFSFNVK